jgi:D-hydroxyproline dehydrogenase subunit alpha
MSLHDLAVIGAGPAGLAASVAAAQAGLSVVLLDAADRPGGQYYRHAASENPNDLLRLRHLVDYRPGHRVWTVEPGFTIHALVGERESKPVETEAKALVIAAGAHDRSLPFPGWDLPGVMTAGGAQALLKGNRVNLGRRVVVAGTGPFLLPVATGLAAAGVDVAAVYEANRPVGLVAARSGALLGSAGKVAEAARYGAALVRHRIPYRWGHAVIAAHGSDSVEAVSVARLDRDWYPVPGSERIVECDALAVGYGFTPQLELPLQLGCATRIDSDGSQVVAVDAAQRTSVPGVFAAGETTGVAGVQAARAEGELAGLAAAAMYPAGAPSAAGKIVGVERRAQGPRILPDNLHDRRVGGVRGLLARRGRGRRFAAMLHEVFAVREGWASWVRDDTLVCRCEEVPYRDVVAAVELGAGDLRSVKLFSRVGMGWCQGRVCGYATACLTAGLAGGSPDTASLGARAIAQPVRLGTLAGNDEKENT